MQTGYFDILGISTQASIEEAKRAYRQKAKLLHPDHNKSADAHDQFVKLNMAFEYVSRYIETQNSRQNSEIHKDYNSSFHEQTFYHTYNYNYQWHSNYNYHEGENRYKRKHQAKKKDIDIKKTLLGKFIGVFFYTCLFVVGIFVIIYPLYTTLHNGIDPDNTLANTVLAIIFAMIIGLAYVFTVIISFLNFKSGH